MPDDEHRPCAVHAGRRKADPECRDCRRACRRCAAVKPATEYRGRAVCRGCHSDQVSGLSKGKRRRGAEKAQAEEAGGVPWPADPVDRAVMLALWTTCRSHLDEPVLSSWMHGVGYALLARLDREALRSRLVAVTFVRDAGDLEQLTETAFGGAPRWRCMDVVVQKDAAERQVFVDLEMARDRVPTVAWMAWVDRVEVRDFLPVYPPEGSRDRIPLPFARSAAVMAKARWEGDDCAEARRIVCRAVQTALRADPRCPPGCAVTWSHLERMAPGIEAVLPTFAGIVRDRARLFQDDTLRWVNRSGRWRGRDGLTGRLREIDVAIPPESVARAPALLRALTDRTAVSVEVCGAVEGDGDLGDELYARRELLRCAMDLAAACPEFLRRMGGAVTLRAIERETGWNRRTMRDLIALMRAMPRLGVPAKAPPPPPEDPAAETEAEVEARRHAEFLVAGLPRTAPLAELWNKQHLLVARPIPGGEPAAVLAKGNLAVLMPDEGDALWPGYSRVLGGAHVF